jgi:predicted transcriptional regulator
MKVRILGIEEKQSENKKLMNDFKSIDLNKIYDVFEVFGSDLGVKDENKNWHSINQYNVEIIELKDIENYQLIYLIKHIKNKYFKEQSKVDFNDFLFLRELLNISKNMIVDFYESYCLMYDPDAKDS